MTASQTRPIVLATGGTGGHVFPAQALAAELVARGHRVVLITDARGAAFDEASEVYRIRAATPGRSPLTVARALVDIARGTVSAWWLLRRLRAAAAVGFGGYASVPTMIAAHWLRLPTVIHEQNAVLGRANRLLARRVSRIATAFPSVRAVPASLKGTVVRTGNPVRPAIASIRDHAYAEPSAREAFNLLVTGGSQGARIFSEVIPEAIAGLPDALRDRLNLVQQCRPEDLDDVRARYREMGVQVELAAFFSDMPQRLRQAHLVIARSGASTVAELTTAGRPALLIPYPYAMDDHQTANAEALDSAAWRISQRDFTPTRLRERLIELMSDTDALLTAAGASRALGEPDAARLLADLVEGELALPQQAGRAVRPLRGLAA